MLRHEVDAEYDLNGKPLMYWLFNSIYYLLLSQSELVCYFLMITHLLSASILSLPLPFAVFLWALLSLPRPNKIFWITCITYIEVCFLLLPDYSTKTFVRIFLKAVVVIKYLFQFPLFPWNHSPQIYEAPLIQTFSLLGIDRKEHNSILEISGETLQVH